MKKSINRTFKRLKIVRKILGSTALALAMQDAYSEDRHPDSDFVCYELKNIVEDIQHAHCSTNEEDESGIISNQCIDIQNNDLNCEMKYLSESTYSIVFSVVREASLRSKLFEDDPILELSYQDYSELRRGNNPAVLEEVLQEEYSSIQIDRASLIKQLNEQETTENAEDDISLISMDLKCINSIGNQWYCGYGSFSLINHNLDDETSTRNEELKLELLDRAQKLVSTL